MNVYKVIFICLIMGHLLACSDGGVETTTTPTSSISASISSSYGKVGTATTVTASGGNSSYSLTLVSGSATMDNANLTITPSSSGDVVFKVTDSAGSTSENLTLKAYVEKTGTISADETWSGYIWITGDITISSSIVNVSSGTEVQATGDNGGGNGYIITLGSAASDTAELNFNGTSGSRISVFTKTGFSNMKITSNFYPQKFSSSYTDFTNLGDSSNDSVYIRPNTGDTATIDNSTFTSCGRVQIYGYNLSTPTVTNSTISSTTSSHSALFLTVSGTGVLTASNNKIKDGRLYTNGASAVISNNVIVGTSGKLFTASDNVSVTNNIIYPTTVSGLDEALYFQGNSPTVTGNFVKGGNGVIGQLSVRSGGTFSDNIFEGVGPNTTDGTQYVVRSIASNTTWSNNIILGYNGLGGMYVATNTQTGITVKNNTASTTNSTPFFVANVAGAGMLTSFRNNLLLNYSSGIRDNSTTTDSVTSTDYNLFYNVTDHYANINITAKTEKTSTGFGLNDQGAANTSVDPVLLSNTFNSTSYTQDELYNGTYSISDIKTAVKAQITPQSGSPAINNGDSSDGAGTDIGAIAQ